MTVDTFSERRFNGVAQRTSVGDECAASMIDLHGAEAWETALAEQAAIEDAGGVQESRAS